MAGKIISFNTKQSINIPAGSYFMGSIILTYNTKPNWFRRLAVWALLGGRWVDIDPKRYVDAYNKLGGKL